MNTAILKNKKTNAIYRHLHDDYFVNLTNGKSGLIEPEISKKVLVISIGATHILNEYPMVEELVKRLSLSIDEIK